MAKIHFHSVDNFEFNLICYILFMMIMLKKTFHRHNKIIVFFEPGQD
jgi:hypothetical protein